MSRAVEYCCPACKGSLQTQETAYDCDACNLSYPVVLGIPDFRLRPDPYLSIADDHEKGRKLAERFHELEYRGLMEYYWQLTPDTPEEMSVRFVEHALAGRDRGRFWLEGRVLRGTLLELGCRSGGVLAAAAEAGVRAVGIDIAFRWLVVARKCLEEAGLEAQLCCCDAEHLPFPENSFDMVLAENVLEHTARPAPLLIEAHRALRPGGRALGITWNRLAPAPEPHVRLWGVGWLPRRVAHHYVRWRGKGSYEHVHLLSTFALRRLLRDAPFEGGRVRAAALSPGMTERMSPPVRSLARLYNGARQLPLAEEILAWVGPVLEWECARRG